MTPLEILKAARELISVPERWTQGGSARDRDGICVKSASAYAVCWCAAGAVYKTGCNDDASLRALRFLDAVSGSTIEPFNDSHTHAEVLAAFDRAIAAAEGGR
jgi:hypothetical protein